MEETITAEEATTNLKACIIAHKGGIPQGELDNAYYKLMGNWIPYLAIGFNSLQQYLRTVTGIEKNRNENNELVYTVSSGKAAHISSMVQRQKDNFSGVRNKKPRARTYSKRKATNEPYRGRRAEKRRKDDARSRARDWNQIYDRASLSDGEDIGDSPWDISDYNRWYEDEYNHPVHIVEGTQKMDVVVEPIISGKQLIGDDFFLQLAIRNAGLPVWRKEPCTALHCGLCQSGQTIKECHRTLHKVQTLSNRVVIMLGAEDIYRGHSAENMISDMEDLLEFIEARFAFSRSAVTLCTLPPLANLSMNCHREQLSTLHRFNSWIREQTNVMSTGDLFDSTIKYHLIEFYNHNTNARIATAYEYFQLDARMVSGSAHPYVLWNLRGRRLAMTLFRGGSC